MTTSFLFWNTGGKRLETLVAQVVEENAIDILVLAESHPDRSAILTSLNNRQSTFRFHPSLCPRIDVYSRHGARALVPLHDDDVMSIRALRLPRKQPVLLVLMHFWSKAFLRDVDQLSLSIRMRSVIDRVEAEQKTQRTILLGDLNIDPYSDALANSEGLHSVMCRRVAERSTRIVKGVERRMFFNPMWSLLGDHPTGPPGTYFKDFSGHPANVYWHTFDQVLFRPCMVDDFNFETLRVVTRAGQVPLLTPDGFPDATIGSDHLPIAFSFSLKGTGK